MPRYKSKKVVPVCKCLTMTRIWTLTLTALACTSLSTSSLNSAACISCLDHKRLQASKCRTSMRTNTTPDMVGSSPFFDTQTTCQVLRTPNRQTIAPHDHMFTWYNNSKYFLSDNLFILGLQLLSDSWSHIPISRQLHFSGNLTDNDGSCIYIFITFHFPAQFNTYPVNTFCFDFSYCT